MDDYEWIDIRVQFHLGCQATFYWFDMKKRYIKMGMIYIQQDVESTE